MSQQPEVREAAHEETLKARRWRQVCDLLHDTQDLAPDRRPAYLEAHAETDPALVAEVEKLLRAAEEAGDFIVEPVFDLRGGEETVPAPTPGLEIDRYRLEDKIGHGGMGYVFRARRADGEVDQTVALKVLRRIDSDEIVERFRHERRILARLEHPNIARLTDVGSTGEGFPYLVMEHVEGLPIDVYCDRQGLGLDERLTLFRKVCGAVSFAHRNLVVHRDLKPSNVLITAGGEPKLLDFGVAKLLSDDEEEGNGAYLTRPGVPVGLTQGYAAPEQWTGGAVTTATDVHALGVLLYLLLTGEQPFPPDQGLGVRTAGSEPPPPPSSRVTGSRSRRLSGDLDRVVLQALAVDPEERYPTAVELADDVERFQRDLPVRAVHGGRGYRARKFLKRHRVGVALTTAALVVLAVFGVAMWIWQQRAELEQRRAEAVLTFFTDLLSQADPDQTQGEALLVVDLLDEGYQKALLVDDAVVRSEVLVTLGDLFKKLGETTSARAAYQAALDARLLEHSRTSREVGLVLTHLAGAEELLGNSDEALRLLEEAEPIFKGDPERRSEWLSVRNNRAKIYEGQKEFEKAEKIHRANLETRLLWLKQGLETDAKLDEQIATTRQNLGVVLLRRDRSEEAVTQLRQALADRRALFPGPHSTVALTMNSLASALEASGDTQEAARLYLEAVEMWRALDVRVPNRAYSFSNLALLQMRSADYSSALGNLDEALSIESLTKPHRLWITRHRVIARAESGNQNLETLTEDQEDMRRLLEGLQKADSEDWQLGATKTALGAVSTGRGNYPTADRELQEALALLQEVDERRLPYKIEALRALARLHEAWGHPEQAQAYRDELGKLEPPPREDDRTVPPIELS